MYKEEKHMPWTQVGLIQKAFALFTLQFESLK